MGVSRRSETPSGDNSSSDGHMIKGKQSMLKERITWKLVTEVVKWHDFARLVFVVSVLTYIVSWS